MQKPLRIDYHLSYWPFVSFIVLALVYLLCIFQLNLNVLYRSGFLLLGIIYFVATIRRLKRRDCEVIGFDGEHWFAYVAKKKLLIEIQQEIFISRFILVLVFKVPDSQQKDSKQKIRCYFSADNCCEADYRRLCSLLLK